MTQSPELLDLYRAGLQSAAELMKSSLESAERLQNQQLTAIRSALEQQAKAMAELGQAKTMDELMAVQTRMAGAQLERFVGYWTGLYQNQMTALSQVQSRIAQAQAGVRQAAKQEQRKSA